MQGDIFHYLDRMKQAHYSSKEVGAGFRKVIIKSQVQKYSKMARSMKDRSMERHSKRLKLFKAVTGIVSVDEPITLLMIVCTAVNTFLDMPFKSVSYKTSSASKDSSKKICVWEKCNVGNYENFRVAEATRKKIRSSQCPFLLQTQTPNEQYKLEWIIKIKKQYDLCIGVTLN